MYVFGDVFLERHDLDYNYYELELFVLEDIF